MFTEDSGIFARFKNFFSGDEKSSGDTAVEETVVQQASEPAVNTPTFDETPMLERTSMVSDESVTEKEIPLRTVEVTAPKVSLPNEKDLDIRFATKFISAGGKFIYCESMQQAVEVIKGLKEDNNWCHVFSWENEIKDAFANNNFQKGAIGFTIENSEAAVSLCEFLIADEGTILLNPKQASRRRLPCFPKTHIIITDIAHLAGGETDALERFAQANKGELPSVIKLGHCNNGHFYDKQRLILNAEGTEDVYVIMVDELIPPSLRP
ncbi:MAG: LUD domain-containing protein [Chitinophagales bacterium]